MIKRLFRSIFARNDANGREEFFPLDLETIANFPTFQAIPKQRSISLLQRCQIRHLSAGEVLLTAGETNRFLYWLLSGELQAYLADAPENVIENQRVGFTISPGESIGEMSIIEDKPVSADVVAAIDCRLLVMPSAIFWEEFVYLPGVMKNLLKALSLRIRKRDETALKHLEQQLKFEYIQKDLDAASKIQANILPHQNPLFPDFPRVDVHATIAPAKEVGGDFFDAFSIDENHLCIAIGDVSGKGVPAALFMIRALTLLRLSISRTRPLAAIVQSINRHLCEGNDDCMFVTLFVGILDVTSGELIYVNGGHNWPLLAREGENFEILKVTGGTLVGVFPEASYTSSELLLQPNDIFVLYTDGVTEAERDGGEFFTLDRTRDYLNSLDRNTPAEAIATGLQREVFAFSDSEVRSDDITILVLRLLP